MMRYDTDFNDHAMYLYKRHIFFFCGYSLQENRAIFIVSTRFDNYASNATNWIIFVFPVSFELNH